MSELMNTIGDRRDFRWQLLATVSAVALLGSVYAAGEAKAADGDSDHPTVWIELGGQLERVDSGEERFAPPFILASPRPGPETISPLSLERDPRYSTGLEGKISFEPQDTDWVFSAAVRYGRTNGNKHVHQQSYPRSFPSLGSVFGKVLAAQFIDTKAQSDGSDAVLDFQAGKDVGLGMFGASGSSTISLGVRFAQFSSKSNIMLKSDPDWHFNYRDFGSVIFPPFPLATRHHFPFGQIFHTNEGSVRATRSFRGVGPSLAWNASQPVLGNRQTIDVALDWGLNAALLFGRQKAAVHHQTTAHFHPYLYLFKPAYTLYQHSADHQRMRTLIVPNIGGFVGASLQFVNAKVSLGYRADFFLGAMDGGIDTAQKENRSFYGPFATISIGFP